MKKIILSMTILMATSMAFAQQRHEISFGYGYPTAMKIDNSIGDAFVGALSGLDLDQTFSGSFNLEYMYRFHSKMAVGMIVGYEHSKMKGLNYKEDYLSFMPAFKMNWVNKDVFRFYSKVAAGITLDIASGDAVSDTGTEFAYQVSPLGFEVGRSVCGFAEVGYGHQGVALVGVRYRF